MSEHFVAKFGGTSLADAGQFQKVVDIVREDPRRRFVIASAPGARHRGDFKVTDALLDLYRLPHDDAGIPDTTARIAERFEQIRRGLGLHYDASMRISAFYRDYRRHATPDAMASLGEFLSAKLLAEALGYAFVDPTRVIQFDAQGRLDMAATRERAHVLLSHTVGCVIPGFYGATPNGAIRTFPRGGSDLSGAVIAAITDAARYENWTDVPGVLSAPPNVIPDAKVIDVIGRRELRELAYMGAYVLHEQTVIPLRGTRIPIHVRHTNRPSDPGTMVVPDEEAPQRKHGTIVGVTGRHGFTAITMEKTGMNEERGFIRQVAQIFERHEVSIEHMPGGIDTLCVIADTREMRGKTDLLCRELNETCRVEHLEVRPNVSLVCTVGNAMRHAHGVASRLFAAVEAAGVSTMLINQDTNERNIIIGVQEDKFAATVTAIYNAFTA